MKYKKEISEALKNLEINKKSYLLDMCEYKEPNTVKYDTELIRKLEVTDVQIHTLKWVLQPRK